MTPQPRTAEKTETAEDVAKQRATPEADEDAPFTVEDFRVQGDRILGNGFALPDVRAAFLGLPKTRNVSVSDAKKRVTEWLNAPMSTEPPIEG